MLSLEYPSVAFLTAEDLEEHNQDPNAHRELFANLQRQIDELKGFLSPFREGVLETPDGEQEGVIQLPNGTLMPLVIAMPPTQAPPISNQN